MQRVAGCRGALPSVVALGPIIRAAATSRRGCVVAPLAVDAECDGSRRGGSRRLDFVDGLGRSLSVRYRGVGLGEVRDRQRPGAIGHGFHDVRDGEGGG